MEAGESSIQQPPGSGLEQRDGEGCDATARYLGRRVDPLGYKAAMREQAGQSPAAEKIEVPRRADVHISLPLQPRKGRTEVRYRDGSQSPWSQYGAEVVGYRRRVRDMFQNLAHQHDVERVRVRGSIGGVEHDRLGLEPDYLAENCTRVMVWLTRSDRESAFAGRTAKRAEAGSDVQEPVALR